MQANIRIVLVETSHPGNIGATARAMKTMGLSELVLVKPRHFPDNHATALAAGATDILQQARLTCDLISALQDCQLAIAVSGRIRHLDWPLLTARDCAQTVVTQAQQAPVALVFGNEQSGLSNQQLQHCHAQVQIPCNPEYRSLNLAAAVQILCYEIYQARLAPNNNPLKTLSTAMATVDELTGYYQHLQQVLIAIGFLDPQKPGQLLSRLQRLYNRAAPTRIEINILRGILNAVQKRLA